MLSISGSSPSKSPTKAANNFLVPYGSTESEISSNVPTVSSTGFQKETFQSQLTDTDYRTFSQPLSQPEPHEDQGTFQFQPETLDDFQQHVTEPLTGNEISIQQQPVVVQKPPSPPFGHVSRLEQHQQEQESRREAQRCAHDAVLKEG